MTTTVESELLETERTTSLAVEWERLALLGNCLHQARNGSQVEPGTLEKLQEMQAQVEEVRSPSGPWQPLDVAGLSPIEMDILASVLAPESEPRIGWMYQSLQAGCAQPFPTPALLQDLLALEESEVALMYASLGEDGLLRRKGLIVWEGTDPFQTIRPAPGLTARLQGWPLHTPAPPGSIAVRERPSWDDLVLPDDRMLMLDEFMLWLRHRSTVVGDWGGLATGGPVALFAGPSGTGKTFAAAVLASDLGWPLYRVDLAKLVSKYIGETEKNLNQLFDAAHGQSMFLQFDEVDSLMSKRGEVKEARDRYANMEVSHLLSRIESHVGPCILTTNLRNHLDQAFSRRFQMVVEFPRPDAEARSRLWQRLLPARAPREAEVDPDFLGRAVNLTGGGIRNAALHAAYLAAGAGKPINIGHLATAVWRELGKEGREVVPSDMGVLAQHLPDGIRPAAKTR